MVIHRKIKSWLDKFKPGTIFYLKCLLSGKKISFIQPEICLGYPKFHDCNNSWEIDTEVVNGDGNIYTTVIYSNRVLMGNHIYKPQEVIKFIEE